MWLTQGRVSILNFVLIADWQKWNKPFTPANTRDSQLNQGFVAANSFRFFFPREFSEIPGKSSSASNVSQTFDFGCSEILGVEAMSI